VGWKLNYQLYHSRLRGRFWGVREKGLAGGGQWLDSGGAVY